MHNFYIKFNKWAATGRQTGDGTGLALALLTSQLECTCVERWPGYLRCQSSSRHRLGAGRESREGKGSEIELRHEDTVFYGHSKAEALGAHRNRTLIFIKTISNTDMVQDIFQFSHQELEVIQQQLKYKYPQLARVRIQQKTRSLPEFVFK